MKIIQINNLYNVGSTGKITKCIHEYLLSQGHKSIVIYGRGTKVNGNQLYKVGNELYSKVNHFISNITGIMYGSCLLNTLIIMKTIKKEKPDVVHLQCINGYFVNIYKLLNFLGRNNIKTVITLHAEFMYTSNCGHALECDEWKTGCKKCEKFKEITESYFFNNTRISWKKMQKAYNTFSNNLKIVSVSNWLKARAMNSLFFNKAEHKVVLNGVDTNVFHYYDDLYELKNKLDIMNKKVILHVTPSFDNNINNIKGGYYFLKLAEKYSNNNDIIFIVAGKYLDNIVIPKNVKLLGNILDQKYLAKLYSLADITILTSKRETFSMVVAESLCCGTPVVGFKAGAPETIAIKEFSEFVEFGNIEKLALGINEFLQKKHDKREISKKSYEKYDKLKMCMNYEAIYEDN